MTHHDSLKSHSSPTNFHHHTLKIPHPHFQFSSHSSTTPNHNSNGHIVIFGGEDAQFRDRNDFVEFYYNDGAIKKGRGLPQVERTAADNAMQQLNSEAASLSNLLSNTSRPQSGPLQQYQNWDTSLSQQLHTTGSVSASSPTVTNQNSPSNTPTDNLYYIRQQMRHHNGQQQEQPLHRKFHCIVHDNTTNSIWLFAGEGKIEDDRTSTHYRYQSLSDLWCFHMETRQWRQYHCLLTNTRSVMGTDIKMKPIYGHSLIIRNRKLYCFGGCTSGGIMSHNEMTNKLCELDLDNGLEFDDWTGEWIAKWRLIHPYVPRGMDSLGAQAAGEQLLQRILGCQNLSQLDAQEVRQQPEREANIDEKPSGRFGHSADLWRSRFMVVLGGNSLIDIWVYDTETQVWFEIEAKNPPHIMTDEQEQNESRAPTQEPRISPLDQDNDAVFTATTPKPQFVSTRNPDIPFGRKFHSSCIIGDDLFMFGGDCRTHISAQMQTLYKFSFHTQMWSRLRTVTSLCKQQDLRPRVYHSMHHLYDRKTLTDCLVLLGGYEGFNCEVSNRISVFELDPWKSRLRANLWHDVRDDFNDCEVVTE